MKKSRSGFTIVELLIVIVMIGILAAITIVTYSGIQARAKFGANQSNLDQINKLILTYYTDNGVYPGNDYYVAKSGNFIPGLVPTYANSLPSVVDTGNDDYWAYLTNATGSEYKLIRVVGEGYTLPSVESQGNTRIDPARPTRGWGVWSSNGYPF